MNRKPVPRCASFKRHTWGEFKPLPPELQAIKDYLIAVADSRAKERDSTRESQMSCNEGESTMKSTGYL